MQKWSSPGNLQHIECHKVQRSRFFGKVLDFYGEEVVLGRLQVEQIKFRVRLFECLLPSVHDAACL